MMIRAWFQDAGIIKEQEHSQDQLNRVDSVE